MKYWLIICAAALELFSSNQLRGACPSKLVIGYASATPRMIPLWIAKEQGDFAKNGIDSEPVLLPSGSTLVTGIAAGDVQIGRTAGAAAQISNDRFVRGTPRP